MREIADRRSDHRYPLKLPLRYLLVHKNEPVTCAGVGVTRDISSGGVAFETHTEIALGSVIELWVSWPRGEDRVIGLELHVVGTIVRVDRPGVALRLERHEFLNAKGGAADSSGAGHDEVAASATRRSN